MTFGTGISIALLATGPSILAVVVLAALLRSRSKRPGDSGQKAAARAIVAAAAIAAAFVTMGVLIYWRLP